MQIYLDYSATTPPRSEVIAAMATCMADSWGNPSSLHHWGGRAATALEQARLQVASLLNAPASAVVFTAGGTEADNLALMGVAQRYRVPQHMIISAVEHSAVEQPAQRLEALGWQVTRLPVDSQGRVNPVALRQALRDNTVLVSIIYGQSEVGTLQPIAALGQMARDHGALFHTDAVQVAGRLPLDVQTLPVDLLSLSSHKIYGPQGAGALYVRPGTKLLPLLRGGGQELGLRSGTQAVPTLAGFGVAAALAAEEMAAETVRLSGLRDRLFDQLSTVAELMPTGDRHRRLPHHVSFCVAADGDRVSGRTLVREMNLAGIGISAGSACHSGKLSPSPVLLAMGYSDRAARCGIRLTLGRHTTAADIDWVAMVLRQVLHRALAPLALTPV
ncbi:cysteine desulfurase family protein [Nodosilinea nodulosa]|uniref:cysteine desulfurase family protein n=1 Tax=Nodosilinea nodulosa TaxID=416001 RepID=UPI0002F550A5|nr:cysteine desulfurase family protein [Nodosilinea nodulosa]